MGNLRVDELRSGMVLAADVYGIQGRKLFPAGITLEEQQIVVMKAWGVSEVDIEGISREDVAPAASLFSDSLSTTDLSSAHLFVDSFFDGRQRENSFCEELYRIAIERTGVRMAMGDFAPLPESVLAEIVACGHEVEPDARKISARQIVSEEVKLFSFPEVYHRILEELKAPASSARRLGEVVSTDPALAVRILRLVNSPCYGFASTVDSIERAVAILGVNELVSLAMGITVMGCFEDMQSSVVSLRYYWEHSFSCAVLAKLIAGYRPGLSEERFFIAGLLHDIGTLLLAKRFPCALSRAYNLSRERKVPIEVAERAVFGYSHADVGALLLEEWGIPESLAALIREHHDPVSSDDFESASVLYIANGIAKVLRNEDCTAYVSIDFPEAILNALNMTPALLETLLSLHFRYVDEVRSIFIGEA